VTRFWVPAAGSDSAAEEVWQATLTFQRQQAPNWVFDQTRWESLRWVHEGKKYATAVGEREPYTGETTLVILRSNTFCVCTANRGVLRGGPVLIGLEEVLEAVPFEDHAP
jgi:hypothetical protein